MRISDLPPFPLIMGILNCTPDSFANQATDAPMDTAGRIEKAFQMIADGADIIDIGGESTRPGATPLTAEEEISRVLPVLTAIRQASLVPISIDTYHAATAAAALDAGADLINDIFAGDPEAGGDAKMFAVAQRYAAPVILMHTQGVPTVMQDAPHYENVAREVGAYLRRRAEAARAASLECIVDPGFGFGKTAEHCRELFRALPELCQEFQALDIPVMVGLSRKSMFGGDVAGREKASVTAAAEAVAAGAAIVRVHDVKATKTALRDAHKE